jgi:hypothetical protein
MSWRGEFAVSGRDSGRVVRSSFGVDAGERDGTG